MVKLKFHKDMKSVLMDPKAPGLKESFYLIKVDSQIIIALCSGLNGLEFNKTDGFLSSQESVQTFQCLYGQGLALLQRNDEQGEAKEFKVTSLSAGRHLTVPIGWRFCFVNVGKKFLVMLGNIAADSDNLDPKPIIQKHGLAYYVIEKKGEIAFEQNPNYSVHPQITTE